MIFTQNEGTHANLIVSSDLHVKISKELPLDWQLNRYRMLFQAYVDLCREHKAVLVLAGDLAHNAKCNLHEMMLLLELFQLMDSECITTHILAGNHENMGAAGTTLDYLAPFFEGSGYVTHHADIDITRMGGCEVVFVGHNRLQQWLDTDDTEPADTRIIFSHFRPTVNQFIKEEIDVQQFLTTGDYFFLGDIHMDFNLAENAVYTNSPLNNTFESAPLCGCLLVTLEAGRVTHKRIPLKLPNLIQVSSTAADYQEIEENYNFIRHEVTGHPEDLRKITSSCPNVKLLKLPEIVETYVETTEIVEEVRDGSLEDALAGYLTELQYSEEKIQRMLEVLREP